MNDFEPAEIKKASNYLQDKLNLFKKGGATPRKDNVYIIEEEKTTIFKRFVNSIFQK